MKALQIFTRNVVTLEVREGSLIELKTISGSEVSTYYPEVVDIELLQHVMATKMIVQFTTVGVDSETGKDFKLTYVLRPDDYFYTCIVELEDDKDE